MKGKNPNSENLAGGLLGRARVPTQGKGMERASSDAVVALLLAQVQHKVRRRCSIVAARDEVKDKLGDEHVDVLATPPIQRGGGSLDGHEDEDGLVDDGDERCGLAS